MKITLLVLSSMLSLSAMASAKCPQVKDQRFKMSSCGQAGNTVFCFANTKKVVTAKSDLLITQKVGQKKVETYLYLEQKMTRSVGEQAGGEMEYKNTYIRTDSELNPTMPTPGAKKFALKFFTSWDYSEGYTSVTGVLPSGLKLDGVIIDSKQECEMYNN